MTYIRKASPFKANLTWVIHSLRSKRNRAQSSKFHTASSCWRSLTFMSGDDSRARGQRRQHPEHRQDAIHRHNPNIPPGSSNLDYRSRALISEIGKYEKALLHIPDRPSSSKSKKNKNKPNEASSRPSSSKNRPRNNDNNKYKDKSGRRRHEGSSKCQDSL